MKLHFASLLAFSIFVAPIFAENLAEYRETIDQISSWSQETTSIKYTGTNKTLKSYSTAQNTAVNTIEKEKSKIKKAESDYAAAIRNVSNAQTPSLGLYVHSRSHGGNAVVAREQIKRDETVKRAERAIISAHKKRIESQKLTLQDLRRKLKKEKFSEDAEKEEQEKLVARISGLIDGLVLPEKP